MPTVGWIHEGIIDRFWESQPKSTLDAHPEPIYVCNCCGKEFFSSEELKLHYNLEHPLELPAIYINGQPLMRESTLRSALRVSDVEVVQCEACHVRPDGGAWETLTVPDFRKRLVEPDNSTWTVRLVHKREVDQARTEEEYHIRFRIPQPTALNAVDALFIGSLVVDELRHSHLQSYEAGLPAEAPVKEYGSALGDYALGIILKERRNPTHAPVGFEEFAVKMRSALEVLRLFHRPVALAVSGSIRFNLNDFSAGAPPTTPDLAIGLNFFKGVCHAGQQDLACLVLQDPSKRANSAVCPVDETTARILAACRSLDTESGLSLTELEALRQLTRGTAPVSEQDLAKIHVICAEGYLRLGFKNDALPHLHAIRFDPMLKQWAHCRLEEYSNHDS
jgi:hypothetical protein